MDDGAFGSRDKRGNWSPHKRITVAPIFNFPPKLGAILKWIFGVPGYLLPWNLFLFAIALFVWFFLTPSMETMSTFSADWIALVFLRNAALTAVIFGALHLRLYIRRAQGTAFKYNPRWLEADSPVFLFGNQTIDNMIWTFASGVPIWTAYEVVCLWAFANGFVPWLEFASHPLGFVALMLAIPMIREFHFYIVHRAIHWPPLYRTVHKLHHYNANPGPWSSLAMHPGEHILYFSGILLHLIIPSHPLHAIFHVHHAALGAVVGHIGFDKLVAGGRSSVDTGAFDHYLHHKYFEVNYADGSIPLDHWFGTFHDGSPEADANMKLRRKQRLRKGSPS